MEELQGEIPEALSDQRADSGLASLFPKLSRTRIQDLISEGYVDLNAKVLQDQKARLKTGDQVRLRIPKPDISELFPEDIPLDIVYEDEDLLVLNKPAGLVVHPAPGHYTGTLVQALLHHCGDSLKGIGGVRYPGIVHRLDRQTSGVMVVAKTDQAHHHLCDQLKSRSLKRIYHALCWGTFLEPQGTISAPMSLCPYNRQRMGVVHYGKEAITHYQVLKTYPHKIQANTATLVECRLATGRTHQIRVHMTHIKHGLLGDPVYGRGNKGLHDTLDYDETLWPQGRQALHAKAMEFIHPRTGKDVFLECDYPPDIAYLLGRFESA
jgi:23S rRNA pseudouridine1911/1915/1917 synthase